MSLFKNKTINEQVRDFAYIKERHLVPVCCIMKVPKQTFATFTKEGASCKYYTSFLIHIQPF